MTIQELLERSGGVIEWTERGTTRRARIGSPGRTIAIVETTPNGRLDFDAIVPTHILDAILAAHAKALGVEEMLAALKAVDAYAYNPEGPYPWEIMDNVRAAIKKAEGVEG